MKLKKYTIKDKRVFGIAYKHIAFANFKTQWLPGDTEAEKRAIKAADKHIIKNNLKYETKILKKVLNSIQ